MVLVDTPIWSLALRRRAADRSLHEARLVREWQRLVSAGHAAIMGIIRQELLSGVRDAKNFELLRQHLAAFEDLPVTTADHEAAARCFNRCRAGGVTGAAVDMLICALAIRCGLPIFTTDRDFERYAAHVPLRLHAF